MLTKRKLLGPLTIIQVLLQLYVRHWDKFAHEATLNVTQGIAVPHNRPLKDGLANHSASSTLFLENKTSNPSCPRPHGTPPERTLENLCALPVSLLWDGQGVCLKKKLVILVCFKILCQKQRQISAISNPLSLVVHLFCLWMGAWH